MSSCVSDTILLSLTETSLPVLVSIAGVDCGAVGLLESDLGFLALSTWLVATRLMWEDMLTGLLRFAGMNPV